MSVGKVDRNEETVFLWLGKAVTQRHAGAQNKLGILYEDERGNKQDNEQTFS